MSNIARAFDHGKALIPFITCGDPDLAATARAVRAMAEAGASLIELGIPFSDPTAEGPVLQAASKRALDGGVTTDRIFDMVRGLRREGLSVPLAFMTYANVVFSYGAEKFISACQETGIDGLILPDVPFEEKEEFSPLCRQYGVDLISLIVPASRERVSMAAREAGGFVYAVPSPDGAGDEIAGIDAMVRLIRQTKRIPCAVDFGISAPEQAGEIARISDGVIVSSAIVELCAQYGADCAGPAADYVRTMKQAISQA